MKSWLSILLLAIAAAAAWVVWPTAAPTSGALTVFCAAGLKRPVEAIAAAYQNETGVQVRLQYGGTGTLLSQLQITHQGDLFIAADDGALADAQKLGLTREEFPLVRQRPVLAVAQGNPKKIASLEALLESGIKLALPNPESASIGRVSKKLLGAKWDALAAKAVVMRMTVAELAADLSLGAVDAAIVWDALVAQFAGLEKVELPELAGHEEFATAAVLSSCQQPAAALKFARYLAAPAQGGTLFQQHGFNLKPSAKSAPSHAPSSRAAKS